MLFWITDRLGTCSLMDIVDKPQGVVIIDVRDLSDVSNPSRILRKRFTMASIFISVGHPVVFRCYAGINRSNALAAATLAFRRGITFDESLELVKSKVPTTKVTQELRVSCQRALRERK
jgi:protein-tyrosine phosphatase